MATTQDGLPDPNAPITPAAPPPTASAAGVSPIAQTTPLPVAPAVRTTADTLTGDFAWVKPADTLRAQNTQPTSGGTISASVKPETVIGPSTGTPNVPVSPTPAQPTGMDLTKTPATTPTTPPPIIDANSIVDTLKQNLGGQLSPDEERAVRDGLANGTLDVSKLGAQNAAQAAQNILNAYRTTRDANLTSQRNQTVYDQNVAQQQDANALALAQQKAKMTQEQNSMSAAMESSGRLQSQNMLQGINDQLKRNQDVYNYMVRTNDRTMAGLADQYKYQTSQLSNAYNDSVSSLMQTLLQKTGAANASGDLNTSFGLGQARSDLDKTLSDYIFHQTNYANQLNALSTMYEQRHKEALTTLQADPNTTNQINDGYVYNQYGQKIQDDQWQPVKINTAMGKFVGTTKLPDGATAMMYQQLNGDIVVRKAEGTQGVQLDQSTIDNYAKSISWGALTIDDLEKAGVPPATISQIISSGNFNHAQYTIEPIKDYYGVVQGYKYLNKLNPKDNYTVDNSGNVTQSGNTAAQASSTTWGTDLSSMYTGNNGPAFANNNPGNIKDTSFWGTAWGQGGFTKFNSVEDGIKALVSKIEYNQSNGVNWVNNGSIYNGDMTLTQYFQKYAPSSDGNNPIAYAKVVASGAWVSPDTKIKDVSSEDMALGIMQHENGALYKELVKRGLVTPEGLNLQTGNTDNNGLPPNESNPTWVDSFASDIAQGKFTVSGQQGSQSTQTEPKLPVSQTTENYLTHPTKDNMYLATQEAQKNGMSLNQYISKYKESKAAAYGIDPAVYEKLASAWVWAEDMVTAQDIANFDANPNALISLKGGQRQTVINAAKLINPAITQKLISQYQNLIDPSSANYKTIQGANTAFGHMSELADMIKDMAGQTDLQKVNSIKQWVMNNTGSPEYTNVKTVMNTLAPELAKIYKPNVTDSEIESFAKQLDPTMSPDQMVEGLKTQINLTSSKLETLADTFRSGGKIASPKILQAIYLDGGRQALDNLGFSIDDNGKIIRKWGNSAWTAKDYSKYFQ